MEERKQEKDSREKVPFYYRDRERGRESTPIAAGGSHRWKSGRVGTLEKKKSKPNQLIIVKKRKEVPITVEIEGKRNDQEGGVSRLEVGGEYPLYVPVIREMMQRGRLLEGP